MIGGNKTASIQTKITTMNEIGERISTWSTSFTHNGFLDYITGESRYTVYNSKIQESTHVFVGDYNSDFADVAAESSRMLIDNKIYDIVLIDNPMELNKQIEVYLKFTGGQ